MILQKLTDKLADKTLSKGCFVDMKYIGIKEIIGMSKCKDTPQCFSFEERNENDWLCIQHMDIKHIDKIIGHDPTLERVLEKLEEKKKIYRLLNGGFVQIEKWINDKFLWCKGFEWKLNKLLSQQSKETWDSLGSIFL